ncbi:MAG TPA: MltA domain-containing protein [Beijerinckiaceae bacterium]
MSGARPGFFPLFLLGWLAAFAGPARPEPAAVGNAALRPLAFQDLAGWAADDHAAALETFRRTCRAIVEDRPALRTAAPLSEGLKRACAAALGPRGPEPGDGVSARRFFETTFGPFEVVPPSGRGFLTGYFEPEYEGSLTPSESFPVPLLARPDDLVTVPQGESLPGLGGLQAGRRGPQEGMVEPYPDRAAIEDGALGMLARPIVYLRDAVDAFIVHVQGSARIRLPDGRTVRVAYAGRNGYPFTAPGRVIVERGHVPLSEMNLERLTAWLRQNPEEGREIMRLNRSYIFFRLADELSPDDGPIGGAGVPLTAGRSLAVDRTLWSYGLPVWLEGEVPGADGAPEPLARLMVAQDTGTAIVGSARGDFFVGSGPEAGSRAGRMRHPVRFVVLLPRE